VVASGLYAGVVSHVRLRPRPHRLRYRIFMLLLDLDELDGLDAERGRLKMRIVSTCKKLEDSAGLQGRTPKAVACAVMWTLLKEKGLTKADLCKICDVSVPTLTKLEAIVMKDLKALT
jgi:DUF1365 family protein